MKDKQLSGVCAKSVKYEIKGSKVYNISFVAGCDGNLKGISSLCEGMEVKEVISRLKGITCGRRSTSCPDQFAKALELDL